MQITDEEKYACAKRELEMRRRVYPRWVLEGRMKQSKADHEIAVMEQICIDYENKSSQMKLDLPYWKDR